MNNLFDLFYETSGVCTDTRKITKDCLFLCLKGDNFNGNLFAEKALLEAKTEKGLAIIEALRSRKYATFMLTQAEHNTPIEEWEKFLQPLTPVDIDGSPCYYSIITTHTEHPDKKGPILSYAKSLESRGLD